jgi:hypothetical protein
VTWKQLQDERRISPEPTDRTEIESLRAVISRSLSDAHLKGLSCDGRFGHAYDAARTLAVIVVRASGYRIKGEGGGHYNTFLALKVAEPAFSKMATYLDVCRRKRNDFLYEQSNVVSNAEAEDFLLKATSFAMDVAAWLKKHHPELI